MRYNNFFDCYGMSRIGMDDDKQKPRLNFPRLLLYLFQYRDIKVPYVSILD